MHVTLYLLSKVHADHNFPTTGTSIYATKSFIVKFRTFSYFFVINMFEAAKRVIAHKIKMKKALSLGNLNKTFDKLNQNKTNLADQCL